MLVVVASAVMPLWASAQQAYPSKPVTLVVTVAAGGSIDAVARLLAQGLGTTLGQPVLVVNRAGAGGNIAAESVASAPPDGHTLLITSSSTLTLNPFVYKSLPFDPEKSFTPIAMPARLNMILVVHPKLGASTVQEFVSVLEAQPDKLNYGSSGSGTLPHLAGVLFASQTRTRSNHVPYKGVAPANIDLLAGHIEFMFDSATTIQHIRAGKLKALAVIGPKRLAPLPGVSTFRELGMPEMESASGWYGVLAPAGTSTEIVQRLNREIGRIMRQPESIERVAAMGLENASATPEEVASILSSELRRFAPIVKQAGVTPQ
ncbi:MAG: tripartite tricarboxylate transporter substrate binding protein [Proteobacteria bacterium]|nr:tripartite tricarboxylate transporter substrate binding protein [Burkholderiales bacterium]